MQFSLIIPCYNNAAELMRELPPLLDYLGRAGHQPETIVVNDGSIQSDELIRFCELRNIALLNHERNRGKGAAVRSGMLEARSDIRIFTDADIPFDYAAMDAILREFENHMVDMVIGDRTRSNYFAHTSSVRKLGTHVFSTFVDLIMLKRMGDTQCGIKGFRARCVSDVIAQSNRNGFAADIEWLHRAQKKKLVVRTVSVGFRNAGNSSVVLWKHALPMLLDVFKIRFS